MAFKKLPAHTAAVVGGAAANSKKNMAEISYFASILKDGATLWFNSLTIEVDPAAQVAATNRIGTLVALCAVFEAQFFFDLAQKLRYLSKFFKTKQIHSEKSEDCICRVQEEGIKARANDEQVRSTIMEGFLPHIQSSVMNHDIEAGALGMSSIRKWAVVAESFQPNAPVSVDTVRLQHQIEELSARLESTQLRVVTEPRKTVQFDEPNKEESLSRSREQSPEPYRGRVTRKQSLEPYSASEPYRSRGTRP